jgi:hypothetical protein
MPKAGAQIEISASSSRLTAGLSAAYGKFMSFGRDVGKGIGKAFKAINAKLAPGDTAKKALGAFGGDLLGRGMDAMIDAAHDVREFESDMQRLGQTTHKTPAAMMDLRASLLDVSAATGISRDELLKASGTYFDLTSDADGMSKAIGSLARVSQAGGGAMEDLVKTSAALKDSMGIGPEQIEEIFSGFISQGEAGKVTLRELAGEAPALFAMFSKFNTGKAGVMQLNAAFQVGAKAFGSASEAATGLQAMMGMLEGRQKQLAKVGVNVFGKDKDGKTVRRNLQDIIKDFSGKNIDPKKWKDIFGENKEGKAFLEMLMKYPDLYKQIVAAGSNAGLVQEYAQNRAESAAGRLDIALNKMKLTIAAAFTPERIEAFVRGVEALADKLGPVVDGVGFVADKLGGLVDVGRSIRGALSGPQNPFTQDLIKSRVGKQGLGVGLLNTLTGNASGDGLADKNLAKNASGYDRAVKSIMGSEVNDRSTKASVRQALFASLEKGGSEAIGASTAGDMYLRAAGTSKGAEREKWAAELMEIQKKGLADIAAAIAASQPQIGDNQVARSTTKATTARRATQ